MYLKSIEVQGFKSFANRINFEFHNGITGIVGPNGSGKSNVADAVRWVLGEQKIKQLRGAKMEDVIFSGTQTRRALGFAYVAIILDNSDHKLPIPFNEVKVSRRVFRSGESEYMINGAPCRLKDVNELFYDTGIGKEGYSIIGQGQIDKILSGKPEDRRELFDEAAGIVKFKRRKLISVKKLEEEKLNLVRVIDIISELENQIKPLERQSEVAKAFLKLRDELRMLEINVFLMETKELKERIRVLDEKYNIVSNDLESSRERLNSTKSEYEKLGQLIGELNNQLESKKSLINQKKLLAEKHEGEVNLLNEQINMAKLNGIHTKERAESITAALDSLNKEVTELTINKREIEEELIKKIEQQNGAQDELKADSDKISELDGKIEELKSEIIELLNEKGNIKSRIQRFDTMLEQIRNRKSELSEQLEKYSLDKEKQEQIQKELEEECALVALKLKETKECLGGLEEKKRELETNEKSLSKSLEEVRNRFHRDESRLESLKNLTERYEGFGNSIRKIMELKERKQGIIGVVADILKVEKKYEAAIEISLGGSIQNIVTDTEKTAKDIIDYLKKNKLGRATFLPLSSIANKTGFTNEKVLGEKGVIGLASDLVEVNKEYERVAKYLLGRIVVADHIDNALILARKYGYTFRIVTLDGELLNIGGSLTGGAFKNSSNLLGRRREIQELEKNILLSGNELKEIRGQIDETQKQVSVLSGQIEEKKIILQEQVLLENTALLNLKQVGMKKKELLEGRDTIDKENEEILRQIEEINSNNDELIQNLKKLEARNEFLEDSITELNGVLEKQKQDREEKSKLNETVRLEYANLVQKESYLQENIDRITKETEKYTDELEIINKSIEGSAKEAEEKHRAAAEVQRLIGLTNDEIISLEREVKELTDRKERQTNQHRDFLEKRDSLSNTINELDKELFRLASQKEKLEESYEQQVGYIWNEYELTYNTALEMEKEALSGVAGQEDSAGPSTCHQLKKMVEKTKTEIRKLGDVNVHAIEEYKNVLERYNFLKVQHDDLIKAEAALMKIIEELDQGMRKQFKEQFAHIRKEFDKAFKELFGGGSGTVELVEDDDILDAGIKIVAQPPGKKLQNIMQLSGGEKALTAIALLFAIQNMKPSPFCLLDEIEAALDDSNVTRFSAYLHKLTKFTQFIVITHRKGTMASADRLYGITMQEKGVSTLVSVNLLENQL